MGNGMLIVVDENNADKIVSIIKNEGYETRIAGKVVSEQTITINNKKWSVD
jgi:phosphoribosylaminoimidazole (AIR) synthetase